MAKAPYEFNSRDELIEYLRSEKTRIRLMISFLREFQISKVL